MQRIKKAELPISVAELRAGELLGPTSLHPNSPACPPRQLPQIEVLELFLPREACHSPWTAAHRGTGSPPPPHMVPGHAANTEEHSVTRLPPPTERAATRSTAPHTLTPSGARRDHAGGQQPSDPQNCSGRGQLVPGSSSDDRPHTIKSVTSLNFSS